MRSCSRSGTAGLGYGLTLSNLVTFVNKKLAAMSIQRGYSAAMVDNNRITVSILPARKNHNSIMAATIEAP